MLKRVLLILCLLAVPFGVLAQGDDSTDDPTDTVLDVLAGLTVTPIQPNGLPDLEGRTVRVAVMNTYPPFNTITDEGEAIGWDYDSIGEICSRLNCEPQFVEIAWADLIPSVAAGTNDVGANGITVTEPRREIIEFSQPYTPLRQILVVRSTEDRFATVAEFAADESLQVIVLGESTNQFAAQDLLGEDSPRIIAQTEFDSMVLDLIEGQVDAILMDDIAAYRFVADAPDALTVIDEAVGEVQALAFAFTLGSPLAGAFDQAIAQMQADGTLTAINNQWLFPGVASTE
jgi:polar amino acid transport system substrate-binding protein